MSLDLLVLKAKDVKKYYGFYVKGHSHKMFEGTLTNYSKDPVHGMCYTVVNIDPNVKTRLYRKRDLKYLTTDTDNEPRKPII